MADRQVQWIQNAAMQRPQLAAQLAELGELYDKKLWHQLTVKLESTMEDPSFDQDNFLIDLYQNFISSFAHKINLLKLGFFAVAVSKKMKTSQEGMAFIQDVIANIENSKLTDSEEPILFLNMQVAQYHLLVDNLTDCKRLMTKGQQQLDTMNDVDPQVSASVHYVALQYNKQQKNYAEFYRSALLYLAFVSQDSLPSDFRLSLAVDVSLAALLGDDVYNFGELLLHPIMDSLQTSSYAWLHELLECFNSGDIHRYDDLCQKHATVLNSQPALVAHERRLREKITILCLMELVNGLPAEHRTIPLSAIADKTKLPMDGVEFLLMKALALHLIEGIIDQVDGTVEVSWVAPRVLTMPQIELMRSRLDGWVTRVKGAAIMLEEETVGVVSA